METEPKYTVVTFEKEEQTGIVTLNRPDHLNAWTWPLMAEMRHALLRVDNDPGLRAAILTGAGRCFCAGADLSAGGSTFDFSSLPESQREDMLNDPYFLKWSFSLRKPVIVAYNGPAVGVGVTMTLPFDIRIAAESARIGIVFNRRGVLPEIGCAWLLPKIIGLSRAAELMYTGRILSAQEALEYGLVSKVVPDGELMPTAKALAKEIATNCAPVSIALTKKMLYQFLTATDVQELERINNEYFMWAGVQPDAQEGIMSFLEKRAPSWTMKVPGDMPDF